MDTLLVLVPQAFAHLLQYGIYSEFHTVSGKHLGSGNEARYYSKNYDCVLEDALYVCVWVCVTLRLQTWAIMYVRRE